MAESGSEKGDKVDTEGGSSNKEAVGEAGKTEQGRKADGDLVEIQTTERKEEKTSQRA